MTNKIQKIRLAAIAATAAGLFGAMSAAQAAATLVIINSNAAGVGFNDPTPVAPVGGNPGTTLGQQRLNAFQHAANIWGTTLTSTVPIMIDAAFVPQNCTATGAVLGSAGTQFIFRDFPGAIVPGTWYSSSLTDKLLGADALAGSGFVTDIQARFNVNIGMNANCLPNSPWYLGLDANHGNGIDLVTVLLHEFGHGLGFQNFTNGSTGNQIAGFPSIWDHFLHDNTQALFWTQMTPAQRQASAINTRNLVWRGALVTNSLPGVLSTGVPLLKLSGPQAGGLAPQYIVGGAQFGAALSSPGVSSDIMPISADAVNGDGCVAFNAANRAAANGNIALISRGVCGFAVKAKNAQNAGAVGVIIQNNVAGSPPPGLAGVDPTVVIPTVSVTQADGNAIRAALTKRSRTKSGVIGNITADPTQFQGADAFGFAQMYAPNPFAPGSSVSHYDTGAFRNQLMEPAINADLTHNVLPPFDLTYRLLQDIGW